MVLVGKEELFEWVEQTTGQVMTTWNDVIDGTIVLRLMASIWGDQIPLRDCDVTWEPKEAADIEKNWIVILTFFNKFGIPSVIDIAAVVVGSTSAIYNLLVMLFFLHHLSRSSSFELAFKIQVDDRVAAFLQSPLSLRVLGLDAGEGVEGEEDTSAMNISGIREPPTPVPKDTSGVSSASKSGNQHAVQGEGRRKSKVPLSDEPADVFRDERRSEDRLEHIGQRYSDMEEHNQGSSLPPPHRQTGSDGLDIRNQQQSQEPNLPPSSKGNPQQRQTTATTTSPAEEPKRSSSRQHREMEDDTNNETAIPMSFAEQNKTQIQALRKQQKVAQRTGQKRKELDSERHTKRGSTPTSTPSVQQQQQQSQPQNPDRQRKTPKPTGAGEGQNEPDEDDSMGGYDIQSIANTEPRRQSTPIMSQPRFTRHEEPEQPDTEPRLTTDDAPLQMTSAITGAQQNSALSRIAKPGEQHPQALDIEGYIKTINHLKRLIVTSAKTLSIALGENSGVKGRSRTSNNGSFNSNSPVEEVQRSVITELQQTVNSVVSLWNDREFLVDTDEDALSSFVGAQGAMMNKLKNVNHILSRLVNRLTELDKYTDDSLHSQNQSNKTGRVVSSAERCHKEILNLRDHLLEVVTSDTDTAPLSSSRSLSSDRKDDGLAGMGVGTLLDYSVLKGECNELKAKVSLLENLLIFGTVNNAVGKSFLWAWSDLVETLCGANDNEMGYGAYTIDEAASHGGKRSGRLQALNEADQQAVEVGGRLKGVVEGQPTLPIAVPRWLLNVDKIDISSSLLDNPSLLKSSTSNILDIFLDAVQNVFDNHIANTVSGRERGHGDTVEGNAADKVLSLGFECIDKYIDELSAGDAFEGVNSTDTAKTDLKTTGGLNQYIVDLIKGGHAPPVDGDTFVFNAKCMQAIEALGAAIREEGGKGKGSHNSHSSKHSTSLRLYAFLVLRLILRDDIWRRRLTHCRAVLLLLIGRTEKAHTEVLRLRTQLADVGDGLSPSDTARSGSFGGLGVGTGGSLGGNGVGGVGVGVNDPNNDPARLSTRLGLLTRELAELQADMSERDSEHVTNMKKLFDESNRLREELQRERKVRRELEAIAETKEDLYRAIVEEQRAYIEATENILSGASRGADRREEIDGRVRDYVKKLNEVMTVEEEKASGVSRSKSPLSSTGTAVSSASGAPDDTEPGVASDICLYYKNKNQKLKDEMRSLRAKLDQANSQLKERDSDITRLRTVVKKQVDGSKEAKRQHQEEKDRLEREISRILTGRANDAEIGAEEILKDILRDQLDGEQREQE